MAADEARPTVDVKPTLAVAGATYAGAHRLIESGTAGPENLRTISRGSVNGILVTGVLRILLFLGILGAVAGGAQLSKADPAGSAFEFALGPVGLQLFGVVLWTAGMTSTIGASFTSATFLRTLSGVVDRRFNLTISAFITICTVAFLLLGQTPSALLVFAGAFNGLILPFGLGLLLWVGWRRRDLLAGLRQPAWLLVIGTAAFVFTVVASVQSLAQLPTIFQGRAPSAPAGTPACSWSSTRSTTSSPSTRIWPRTRRRERSTWSRPRARCSSGSAAGSTSPRWRPTSAPGSRSPSSPEGGPMSSRSP